MKMFRDKFTGVVATMFYAMYLTAIVCNAVGCYRSLQKGDIAWAITFGLFTVIHIVLTAILTRSIRRMRAEYKLSEQVGTEAEEVTHIEDPTPTEHVYDWLDLPAENDAERDAKEWLNNYCKPAYTKYEDGIDKWLARYRVTVEWKGQRYTCSGASRMGDVWIKTEGSDNYYDHRVYVSELSNWKRITLPLNTEN